MKNENLNNSMTPTFVFSLRAPCQFLSSLFVRKGCRHDEDIPIGKCPKFAIKNNIEFSVRDGKRQVAHN